MDSIPGKIHESSFAREKIYKKKLYMMFYLITEDTSALNYSYTKDIYIKTKSTYKITHLP